MKLLSVVIATYNEEKTLETILKQVEAVKIAGVEKEIVIVDDGSTDKTREILKKLESKFRIFYHPRNIGKGAAIRTGFFHSQGDFIIIQDADLEYDPREYQRVLQPLIDGRADVVYGSRFIGSEPHRVMYFWHYIGNRFLTLLSNIFTGMNLTDMEVCYKSFTKEALEKIMPVLQSNRFGIEPEITARLATAKLRIYEVGVSYYGRSYTEGKKINWKDGLAAIWHIIKFNLWS